MVKISGIYAYYDYLKHKIIYIGKDSNIEKNVRHKAHYAPSLKDSQKINKILQNDNSGRYFYVVLEQGVFTNDELNQKEISWISFFNPRFNFTDGGEGIRGYKHSEKTREKMSRAHKGKYCGENSPNYGKKLLKEHREKISCAMSGKNNPNYGKKFSKETRKKMSRAKSGEKNSQFNPCIKIRKEKSNSCKEGFIWRASPSTLKKLIHISSVDLEKCIEKVEDFLKSEKNVYGYDSYEVVDE